MADSLSEANETLTLTLSQPTGGATLGAQTTMTVVILDTTDTKLPTVTISTPKANAIVPGSLGGSLDVLGAAADDKGISSIQVQLNGGSITIPSIVAALGSKTATWTLSINPIPGINELTLRSIDMRGNVSKPLLSKFTYQVTSTLTVNVNDDSGGSVTKGFAPSSAQFLSTSYKITATSKKGFIFSGWTANNFANTGVTPAAQELPALTFIMQPGLVLTANFILNPFTVDVAAGVFHSLVAPHESHRQQQYHHGV